MKLIISVLVFPILLISQAQYSQTYNQYKPDSVVYIKSGSIIIITTKADTSKTSYLNSNPLYPDYPTIIHIDSAAQIKMTILDSSYSVIKNYIFDAKIPGEYQIYTRAFYENLPHGKFIFIIEHRNKFIKQIFLK